MGRACERGSAHTFVSALFVSALLAGCHLRRCHLRRRGILRSEKAAEDRAGIAAFLLMLQWQVKGNLRGVLLGIFGSVVSMLFKPFPSINGISHLFSEGFVVTCKGCLSLGRKPRRYFLKEYIP